MPARKNAQETAAQAPAPRANGARPRGRPRREIDLTAVADVAAKLFNEQGYDAVSIEAVAEELSVSRATLYRTVPTKEDLLGMVLESSTAEVHQLAIEALEAAADPSEALFGLIRMQIAAAIRLRDYLSVFFGGAGLPPDTYARWRVWARDYEDLWVQAVSQAMDAGVLEPDDPKLTTRLMLGMIMWICRWYHPSQNVSADEIADSAIKLIRRASAPNAEEPAPWVPLPPVFSDRR
ncbi:TetR/AcrR family transcriptional regulator [Nocardia miyunensis]|uniref:TetR/AcrR family transcriptional regulator n=1 Tax=Nocardia miyunensis TaxID=282684 RepID=UPI000A076781|nr:TetR/AcrR family transcriptional regulator [Nocardia miyunensis]